MALNLKFRFRPTGQTDDRPQALYVRLTLNKVMSSDYVSGVRVRPSEWDQKAQLARGRSPMAAATNERLAAIRTEHHELLNQLLSLKKVVTVQVLKAEWTKGSAPVPLVCQAWETHNTYLRSLTKTDQALSPATILKWENGIRYLRMYIDQTTGQRDIDVSEVSVAWAKRFHQWLMTHEDQTGKTRKARQANNTAQKYVAYLRAVLDTLVEARHIANNPLQTLKISRTRAKKITYLNDEQIARLAGLPLVGTEGRYRDLALLAIYTGLDYPDLLKLLANADHYRQGDKLVMERGKTTVRSLIPVLPETEPLLATYAGKKYQYAPQSVNKSLKIFASLIGFEKTLSLKICRKTTGTLFLNAGYSLEAVSMILGHADFRTTRRHYAEFLDKRLSGEMAQIGVNILLQPIPMGFAVPSVTAP